MHKTISSRLSVVIWTMFAWMASASFANAQDNCCGDPIRTRACCGRTWIPRPLIRRASCCQPQVTCCSDPCAIVNGGMPGPNANPNRVATEAWPPPGAKPLFNGTDLAGWHGLRGIDPRELSAMGEESRANLLHEDDDDMLKHWRVENGEIVNDGEGVYLASDANFRDYELWIDYKTVAGADSGIYLKGTPQVQIWDYTEAGGKWNIGADKGSGGLWNNEPGNGKDPLVLADKPFGEWNRVRVLQVGNRTSVWMNDKLVVDWAILENYWDKNANPRPNPIRPVVASGPIQLQTHGGEIRWRNVFVREIPPQEANAILAQHDAEGFASVFNGRDFTGWSGPIDNFEIVDGSIRCKPHNGGTIFTTQEYDDFAVRLEFKLPAAGNNGLAIRYPGDGDTAYVGMCEMQVLDSEHADYKTLDSRQYHGSAYGMVAAHRGYLRDTGEWNFQQVTVQGSRIKVELNGVIILDADLATVSDYLGGSAHPGKDRTAGHFGFAGHNDPVAFRNVSIRRLKP